MATWLATPSSANLIATVTDESGTGALLFGTTPTIATPVINGLPTGTGVASAATASTLVSRDANANTTVNNLIESYQTIATAAGTTTFTVSTPYQTYFTGSTTQTVTLPVTSTLVLGQQFAIANASSGTVTVNSSGSNLVQTMTGGTGTSIAVFTCILTSGTTAASWSVNYLPLVLPIASGGTNSTATPTTGGIGYGTGTAHAYTSASNLFWDQTNKRFSINKSSPSYEFTAQNSGGTAGFAFDCNAQQMGTTFGTGGAVDFYAELPGSSTGGNFGFGGSTRGDDRKNATTFKCSTVEYMRIDGDFTGHTIGNIGIRRTTPVYALDVNGTIGSSQLSLGTSLTDGIIAINGTAAAAGAQQYSPMISWEGKGWKTTATAASRQVKFQSYCVPVQGSAAPTGSLQFDGVINGVTTSNIYSLSNTGDVAFSGGLTMGSVFLITSAGITKDMHVPTASNQFGTLNVGGGGVFQGNAGEFVGSSSGTSIAVNELTGYGGSLLDLQVNGTSELRISAGGLATKYGGVTTVGLGHPAIYGAGRVTAQTAANTSIATYTVGAADASFIVSENILVTTATAHSFTGTCDYTDEGNTARTITFSFQNVGGTILTTITNAGGAVPYEGIPLHIRCKASTAITLKTAGTFTTVTYNAEGLIAQYQ